MRAAILLTAVSLLASLSLSIGRPATEIQSPLVPPAISSLSSLELKGDLSFLASDALQGRYTPSPSLEVAAEFIASRFRGAGLKSASGKGYFQPGNMIDRVMPALTSGMTLGGLAHMTLGGLAQPYTVPKKSIAVLSVTAAVRIDSAPVLFLKAMDPKLLQGVDVAGRVVAVPQPDFRSMPREKARGAYADSQSFQNLLRHSKAALEVQITKTVRATPAQLVEPDPAGSLMPRIAVSADAEDAFRSANAAQPLTVSIDIPAPADRHVTVKNVVAILPGSDPALKNSYVLVTAHYDHIGTTDTAARMANPESTPNPEDHIYNGANDDGSGTVSVLAIARALAKVNPRPRRSVVFLTFFGEERGELGSAYYVRHPIVPLAQTVADINLEQVGRTDELDSGKIVPRLNSLSLTGFDYSDVADYVIRAGRQLGIHVYKDPVASDAYFTQSDNAAFAEAGIPAHSVTVAFDYPDYHGVGDEWQKIDYNNMARVDRALALSVLQIANAVAPPRWAAQNPKTAAFQEAHRQLLFRK